jgi:hypothetical protein
MLFPMLTASFHAEHYRMILFWKYLVDITREARKIFLGKNKWKTVYSAGQLLCPSQS